MTIYGYARVSKEDGRLDRQLDRLTTYGCDKIFQEKISATSKKRIEFNKMMDIVRASDVIVVCELDRLFREVTKWGNFVEQIQRMRVECRVIATGLSTTNKQDLRYMRKQMDYAQDELENISQRVADGMRYARLRGSRPGTKYKISDKDIEEIKKLRAFGLSYIKIAKMFDVSTVTICNALKRFGVNDEK